LATSLPRSYSSTPRRGTDQSSRWVFREVCPASDWTLRLSLSRAIRLFLLHHSCHTRRHPRPTVASPSPMAPPPFTPRFISLDLPSTSAQWSSVRVSTRHQVLSDIPPSCANRNSHAVFSHEGRTAAVVDPGTVHTSSVTRSLDPPMQYVRAALVVQELSTTFGNQIFRSAYWECASNPCRNLHVFSVSSLSTCLIITLRIPKITFCRACSPMLR
jgi:hypothetical protein